MVFSSGERGTNPISINQLFKVLGNTHKTVDTEFDTFNKTLAEQKPNSCQLKAINMTPITFSDFTGQNCFR